MHFRTWIVFVAVLSLSFEALAKPDFPTYIPNGQVNSCNNCHVTGEPKTVRNPFGISVFASLKGGKPDWIAVCDADADNDDATNGQELGDASCAWVKGDPNPGCKAAVSLPASAGSTPGASCGDGNCDAGEDVDCCPADCEEPVADPPPADTSQGTSDVSVPDTSDVSVPDSSGPDDVPMPPIEDTAGGAPDQSSEPPPIDTQVSSDGTAGDGVLADTIAADTGAAGGDDDGGCQSSEGSAPLGLVLLGLGLALMSSRRKRIESSAS
jgi:uncharacterized protein (TIGR03382 family)